MFAIGEYINGRWRYLSAASTVDSFRTTADLARAWPFDSVASARVWFEGIPGERADALARRFTRIVGEGGSVDQLDDPLDWLDGRTFTVAEMREAESYRWEPKAMTTARPAPAKAAPALFRDGGSE